MDNLLHACEYAHLFPGRDPTAFVMLSKASTTQEGLLASGIKRKKWRVHSRRLLRSVSSGAWWKEMLTAILVSRC